MTYNKLDFLSRNCKANRHYDCSGKWFGLGLEVYCYCGCHTKKEEALAQVEGPETNAHMLQSSGEVVHR